MTYKTYIAVLVLSAVASFLFTPLARRVAVVLGAMDLPGGRKIHAQPMPRLGGLAVFGGFCFPWGFFYLLDNRVTATFQNYEKLFVVLMAGAFVMLALGVVDDVKGLRAAPKFAVQITAAVGLYFGGYQIDELSNPFGPPIQLGWLALPVSVFWIVGVTNAINLLDGIDGLAAGVTACIALSLAVINVLYGNIIVALLTLCLAGACAGFLPYNFAPARIFLGDSGSLFLGLVLSCIGILSLFKAATATFVAVPVILFALPLIDTTSVFVGRLWRGVPVFRGDRTHVHHRLLALGLNHRQAALFLYAITLLLGIAAIALTVRQTPVTLTLGALLLALLLGALGWRWRNRKGEDMEPGTTLPASEAKTIREQP
jgi:UDP-GlcNAc:undecaprenyl-phosphate/decaprenyl-phosphate GlcNAc-1-phosphate transferase